MAYRELSLLEFQERFGTEEACEQALEQARWPNGFICPKCGHDGGYRLSSHRLMQCASCRRQTSLTAGTVFHKTRIPLRIWFWMMYLVANDKGGTSALRLSKQLEMRYETVWFILQKIRSAMQQRDEKITLSGFLEIDQAFFGRAATAKKPRKAHNQAQVLVVIESMGKKAGNVFMQVIDAASRDSIREVLADKVEPVQAVRTDGLQANYVLRSMGHRLNAKPLPGVEGIKYLPWVHIAISLAKRFILGTYHGVSTVHLQRYLDEFCYRFNRRQSGNQLFDRLLKATAIATPCYYAELTG
jgi:transposase-like protein